MIIKNGKTITSIYKGNQVIDKIMKGTLVVYEAFKNLIASGVPPLTLTNCKGVDLIDYKIYGNSVQDGTPTPDTPVEVESVGEKTKNLVDINALNTSFMGGSVTNIISETGSFYVSGSGIYGKSIKSLFPNLKAGVEYFLSGTTTSTTKYIYVRGDSPLWYLGTSKVLTQEQIDDTTGLGLYSGEYKGFMISEGTSEAPYEPYGYKIPVKVNGKNLFDGQTDYAFCGSGTPNIQNVPQTSPTTYNKYQGCAFAFPVIGGKTYTISGELNASGNGQLVSSYRNQRYGAGSVQNWGVKLPITITVPEGKTWLILAYWSNEDNNTLSWSNIQCEEGDKATEYAEPINPIITNIYLDELLRKIGDYSDYVDFENSKIIRKNTSIDMGELEWSYKTSNNRSIFTTNLYTIQKQVDGGYSVINVLSSIYKPTTTNATWVNGDIAYAAAAPGETVISVVNNNYNNAEDFKNAMSNVMLDYVLETPTEETIKLPNIPTIKGTTILSVDTTIQPSNLEVVYKGKEVKQ